MGMDLYIEVNHGPYLIDNNICLSKTSRHLSQGGAFVHNWIGGIIKVFSEPECFTPYHLEQSTTIKGITNILGGDNRFYNNLFCSMPVDKNYIPVIDKMSENVKNKGYGLNAYKDLKLDLYIGDNIF